MIIFRKFTTYLWCRLFLALGVRYAEFLTLMNTNPHNTALGYRMPHGYREKNEYIACSTLTLDYGVFYLLSNADGHYNFRERGGGRGSCV